MLKPVSFSVNHMRITEGLILVLPLFTHFTPRSGRITGTPTYTVLKSTKTGGFLRFVNKPVFYRKLVLFRVIIEVYT